MDKKSFIEICNIVYNGITLLRFTGTNYPTIKSDLIRYLENNLS